LNRHGEVRNNVRKENSSVCYTGFIYPLERTAHKKRQRPGRAAAGSLGGFR
jgi:hypothetical protein